MVSSVMAVLGESRVQDLADKLGNLLGKTKNGSDALAMSPLKIKPTDPYVELTWVPEAFMEEAGSVDMLTTLGYPWLYSSVRACMRCGTAVMPIVGVGTFYLAASGHSSWLFAWPIAEQVKLGVDMDDMTAYLQKFSLPDMVAFVKKGFHTVIKAKRVVWVPYGYNTAIVSLNTEIEDAGADSKAHILAMPMFSDKMAGNHFTPDVVKLLIKQVATHRAQDDVDVVWEKFGPVYESWLTNFAGHDDDDGHDSHEGTGKSASGGAAE